MHCLKVQSEGQIDGIFSIWRSCYCKDSVDGSIYDVMPFLEWDSLDETKIGVPTIKSVQILYATSRFKIALLRQISLTSLIRANLTESAEGKSCWSKILKLAWLNGVRSKSMKARSSLIVAMASKCSVVLNSSVNSAELYLWRCYKLRCKTADHLTRWNQDFSIVIYDWSFLEVILNWQHFWRSSSSHVWQL